MGEKLTHSVLCESYRKGEAKEKAYLTSAVASGTLKVLAWGGTHPTRLQLKPQKQRRRLTQCLGSKTSHSGPGDGTAATHVPVLIHDLCVHKEVMVALAF